MACVTELRLQRLDRAAVIGLTPVGPLRSLVDFLLQLRGGAPLAIDLQQRALFRRTQALVRLRRRLAQLLQIAREAVAHLLQFAAAGRRLGLQARDLHLRRRVGRDS